MIKPLSPKWHLSTDLIENLLGLGNQKCTVNLATKVKCMRPYVPYILSCNTQAQNFYLLFLSPTDT